MVEVITGKKDRPDAKSVVLDANRIYLQQMSGQMEIWKSGIEEFENRGPVDNPYSINAKLGQLFADLQTIVPRDAYQLVGASPFFPIQAVVKEWQWYADCLIDIADYFCNQGAFFAKFVEALFLCRGHGAAFIEPRYRMWPKRVSNRLGVQGLFGQHTGTQDEVEDDIDEGIEFVVHPPWAVRCHRHGNSLLEKPAVIIAEAVHVSEIERLIDQGVYKLADDVGVEVLRNSMPSNAFDLGLHSDASSTGPQGSAGSGILLRYYSDDRWVHLYNDQYVLLDTDNQNVNMDKRVKPVAMLRNVMRLSHDRFWPMGEWEIIRELNYLGEQVLSLYYDQAVMNANQMLIYDSTEISPENLRAENMLRIPVKGSGKPIDQIIQSVKLGQAPRELLELYSTTKDMHDQRVGLFNYQTGENPPRKETARASSLLSEAGNTRVGFGIMQIEQGGLREVAYLTYKQIAAYLRDGMRLKILGWDRAQRIASNDPDSIPGGFLFSFKGSDKITRQAQKRESLTEAYNMVRNQPTILNPWVFDRLMLESIDVIGSDDLDKMGLTEEQQNPPQPQPQLGPPAGAPPPEGMMPPQASPVSQTAAIVPPGQIPTPATNVEVGV